MHLPPAPTTLRSTSHWPHTALMFDASRRAPTSDHHFVWSCPRGEYVMVHNDVPHPWTTRIAQNCWHQTS